MLLQSYIFGSALGKDEVPEEVLHLFYNAIKEGDEIKYASEIIEAGLDNRINFSKEFNLPAYIYTIEHNGRMLKGRDGKKFKSLDNGLDFDDGDIGKVDEERLVIEEVKSEIDMLMDNDELQYAISKIKGLNEELLFTEGVDLLRLLKTALKGIPKAIAELRRVCDFYPVVAENVHIILSSGKDLGECLSM